MVTALPVTGIRLRSARFVAADLLTPVWHPSPNFGERRGCLAPDMVVLHYTAMPSTRGALDWLCREEAQVSAHYLVGRKGTVWQMVDEAQRAWHAGAGAWGDVTDVNSHSIGIEISNDGTEPFPDLQMVAVENLLRGIIDRWTIAPERIVAHSDTAVGRKIDPGRHFDWLRLARQGLAIWPEQGEPGDFLADARSFGYRWEEGAEERVLNAFRLRFRPWATGDLDDTDRRLMSGLARRWPAASVVPLV